MYERQFRSFRGIAIGRTVTAVDERQPGILRRFARAARRWDTHPSAKRDFVTSTPEARPPDSNAHDNRAYYLCQLGGWSFYAVLANVMAAQRGDFSIAGVMTSVSWCATGLVGTHLLRTYSKRRPWTTFAQFGRRLGVAVVCIPVAMIIVQNAVGQLVWQRAGKSEFSWSSILIHLMQAGMITIVWCAIYFSAQEMRRRRAAELEALRLALVAQVAQFHTLRSQLNPHFLFNCLNSLRELIAEDPDRAQKVVTELAELLRYTLQADRVETVPLGEEMRAVERYLSLEKVRFEGRLRLRFEIAPEVLSAGVPPMLIQTLAENGLKHGIAKLPEGGELAISARLRDGHLEIHVTNPGSMITSDSSTSVGLANARERLRLVYGDAASLKLREERDKFVEAAVTIPLVHQPAHS